MKARGDISAIATPIIRGSLVSRNTRLIADPESIAISHIEALGLLGLRGLAPPAAPEHGQLVPALIDGAVAIDPLGNHIGNR